MIINDTHWMTLLIVAASQWEPEGSLAGGADGFLPFPAGAM